MAATVVHSTVAIILILFCYGVTSQTTSVLPPPPTYSTGVFLWPDTTTTQIFTDGSTMNVTWQTTYDAVNLYLIFGQNYATPYTCITGSAQTWWLWDPVNDHHNNTLPFSFRAVDTYGTQEDQLSGGFYTGQFWIADISSTSSTTSTMPMTSTSSVAQLTPPTSTQSKGTASSTPTNNQDDPGNTVAIGAGVGVGVGVVVIAAAIGAFFLYRRRKQKKQGQTAAGWAGPQASQHNSGGWTWTAGSYQDDRRYTNSTGAQSPYYDTAAKYSQQPPVEAEGSQAQRYELSNNKSGQQERYELPNDNNSTLRDYR